MIYREQAKRLIAVKFSVRGRDLASAVAEAQEKTQHLFKPPYRAVWSGEFEEMQDAETRLMWIVPLSLGLIFILLYSALRSWLDAVVVLSNVLAVAMGGVWALYLTGTNFSISAAVGFISLFGVAIMDGLLMISYFNTLRAQGRAVGAGDHRGGRQTRAARDDDRPDGLVRIVAGGPFHANRFADPAAAGHRRGRRHGHDVVAHPLSYAGALQFLRPSRTACEVRQFRTLTSNPEPWISSHYGVES